MTYFHFTAKSANAKTGPMPTTTTSDNTCPPSCAMFDTCYAKGGPQAMHWRKVSAGERGGSLTELCDNIRNLEDGTLWRHDVSGDLPGEGERINGADLRQMTAANTGRKGFTYTHKHPSTGSNAAHIKRANHDGFTINLSANDLSEADEFASLGIAPVVTILPIEQTTNTLTPEGRRVVVCPATQRDDVTCESCKLCSVQMRGVIVGFPVHGSRKRMANENLIARG
jgi:hypothetical protein